MYLALTLTHVRLLRGHGISPLHRVCPPQISIKLRRLLLSEPKSRSELDRSRCAIDSVNT